MRIISLVPSLTETLFAFGVEDGEVIGRTSWCVHPAERVASVPKLGGTKTPNVDRIIELRPDLVVLEREENPKAVWERLVDAGVETFVAHVLRVADVPPLLRELGAAVGRAERGEDLAAAVEQEQSRSAVVPVARHPKVMPLIWNEPLMAVGPGRYAGDLVRSVGFDVVDPEPGTGYPEVTPALVGSLGVEVLLLTSEPHDFSRAEGEAIADSVKAEGFDRPKPVKVDGEALTWFGCRTMLAIRTWREVYNSILLEL